MDVEHSKHKIALLHYWLLGMRGGEMVLEELCRMFPQADVFTHAARPEKLSADIASHCIRESMIARLPLGRTHCQRYLPLMPAALKRWDFSSYDLIISSESGPVKGIRKPAGCRHICYCHSPMRYVWDLYDEYYRSTGLGGRLAMRAFRGYLKNYDLKSSENVDQFIANSKFVAERIKRIYGRDSVVVYPPVEVEYFQQAPELERRHFLFVGQLVCYKQPEIAVRVFAGIPHEKLIVVGEGPQLEQLRRTATPNIEFQPRVSREKLRELYASAKALIFPGIEDFGIVPVEAQAAGCPVIALRAGGALETVAEEETGIFFDGPERLAAAVERVKSMNFPRAKFQENTARFTASCFQFELMKIINS